MGFLDFMTESIAIDLGTANTLIIHNDKVVVDEPSIVAKDVKTDEVIASLVKTFKLGKLKTPLMPLIDSKF